MALEYPTESLPPDFPVADSKSLEVLARIHHESYGPWFLDSGPSSRFNLDSPWGTCYAAEVDLGAFMEKFVRTGSIMSQSSIEAFRISHFEMPAHAHIADFTSPLAKAAGVTAEIHSSVDYDKTRAWARAANDGGFDGIRYFAASDPSCSLVSVALFSKQGGPGPPIARTDHISPSLLQEAADKFGIRVVPASFSPRPTTRPRRGRER